MLVNSGASDYFVDTELIPELQQSMKQYQRLYQPKPIVTTDNQRVVTTSMGTICGHTINLSEQPTPVRAFAMVVPGMGRHLISSSRAIQSAVRAVPSKEKKRHDSRHLTMTKYHDS